MKESKEIAKYLDLWVKQSIDPDLLFEGSISKILDWGMFCLESGTKQLRKENERLVESNDRMAKLIADHVDRGDRIMELEEGIKKEIPFIEADHGHVIVENLKSLLTKDTKNK